MKWPDKDLCSGALVGHFHSVEAVHSWVCVLRPQRRWPDGGLDLFSVNLSRTAATIQTPEPPANQNSPPEELFN